LTKKEDAERFQKDSGRKRGDGPRTRKRETGTQNVGGEETGKGNFASSANKKGRKKEAA